EALREMTETAAEQLAAAQVSIWLFDETHSVLRCCDEYDRAHRRHADGFEIVVGDCPLYFGALKRERALVVDDVLAHPDVRELLDEYLLPAGITSMLDAPVRLGGEVIGVVCSEHIGPPRTWTTFEQEFASSLADMVALVCGRDERRRARRELEEQRTLLRALLDTSPNLIFFKDRDSIVRVANRTYCEWLNRPMEEVVGKSVFDWFPEEYAWRYRDEDLSVMESGTSLTTTREVPDPSGEIVWYEVIKQPLFDAQGQVIGLLSTERDITEKRMAEEERKESEARYQRVLEASNTGIWDWNLLTGEAYFSPRWKAILGYEDHELANVWTIWAERLHPDDRAYMTQELADFLRNPVGNFEREFRMRHKDGSYRWILNRSAAMLNERGEATRMGGSHLDVTARKEMEVVLNSERRQLLALFDGIDEVIYVSDPNTYELIYVNDAFRRTWGDVALGKPCYQVVQGLDAPCTFCRNDEVFGENAGKAYVWEFQNHESGRWFRCTDKIIRWSDGRHVRFELAADITNRKQMEEHLRESEERFRSFFEIGLIGMAVVSPVKRWIDFNDRLCEILGYSREELLELTWADLTHPDDLEASDLEFGRALAGESEGYALDKRFISKSGMIVHARVAVKTVRDSSGAVDHFLALLDDIGDRKQAEQQLRRTADELARSNAELQQFAYVASHDLQEPLRSIVSFVQLLERRYRGRFDDDADEMIGYIVEGGSRMQVLINDLLAFSRVSTRGRPFGALPLDEVVRDAVVDLRCVIAEGEADVRYCDLPTVWGDRGQLVQVFENLISNAIKFRRPDVPPEVTVSAVRDRWMWHVMVADNGIGIEGEYYDRIFVIFQRLHTRDVYQGTGIGLAIVKKIVERHGGRVWVDSVPGEGSVFHVTLPVVPQGGENEGAAAADDADLAVPP
ncbi:MAG TPA: PAS domain S-box protein, partial [Methanoregulaceae archaeon]|nr:PAS domain S-box protein [Methanoregulaceae archaeon]